MSDLKTRKITAPNIGGWYSLFRGAVIYENEEQHAAARKEYSRLAHHTLDSNNGFNKSFEAAHPETKKLRRNSRVSEYSGPQPRKAKIPTPATNSIFNVKASDD